MFLKLKNTLRHVHIRPCSTDFCRCFEHLQRQNKREYKHYAASISEQSFYQYEKCYKKQTNINRDVFLL